MIVIETGYSPTPDLRYPRIGYDNLVRTLELVDADVTASSTAAGYAKDAPLSEDTSESWQPDVDTDLIETWDVDIGSAQSASYVGIVGSFDGCEIELQRSSDNSAWTTVAETAAPLADETRVVLFLFDTKTYRYWRLRFTLATPTLSVFYIGAALAVEQRIYGGHAPIMLSRETPRKTSLTKGGQFLGIAIRREGVTGAINLEHLGGNWYRSNFDPFVRAAREHAFFWAWRPEDDNVDTSREVAYLWSEDDIRPDNMGKKDLMSVSFGVRGISNS